MVRPAVDDLERPYYGSNSAGCGYLSTARSGGNGGARTGLLRPLPHLHGFWTVEANRGRRSSCGCRNSAALH